MSRPNSLVFPFSAWSIPPALYCVLFWKKRPSVADLPLSISEHKWVASAGQAPEQEACGKVSGH